MSSDVSFKNVTSDDYGNVSFELIVDEKSTNLWGDSDEGVLRNKQRRVSLDEIARLAGGERAYKLLSTKEKFPIADIAFENAHKEYLRLKPYVEKVWPEVSLHIKPKKVCEPEKEVPEPPPQAYVITRIWYFVHKGSTQFIKLWHTSTEKQGRIFSLFARFLTFAFGKPEEHRERLDYWRLSNRTF